MPLELTIVAVTALLAGLLLVGITLAWRRPSGDLASSATQGQMVRVSPPLPASQRGNGRAVAAAGDRASGSEGGARGAEAPLRIVWLLTVTTVLLGLGISGSFAAGSAPIIVLGAAAVVAVVIFHELSGSHRRGPVRLAELLTAIVMIGALLALTGFASSPFAMLFALVAVAAALSYGPRAGLLAAVLATLVFGAVLVTDPNLLSYTADDALRLSIGLGATWLLAFVAIAYAGRQRRAVAHALALSRTDALTGLFNRSQLFVTLEQEVSRTRRSDRGFCILMIDLDGLKAINDSSGHLRGDEVLRSLGGIIRNSIRTVDSAYRYGGDEFVVLLPETDIVGAFVVAEKIRAGAEDVGMLVGPEPVTSVSIGLVSHPEDGLSAEELMTAADRAMYQAKKLGKNQISGNPRARPALIARRSGADASRDAGAADAARPDDRAATAPSEARAVAVELGTTVVRQRATRRVAAAVDDDEQHDHEDHDQDGDQADAVEVRRQMAVASRSFDPDHQIRRAMDAFLSPVAADQERRTPDH